MPNTQGFQMMFTKFLIALLGCVVILAGCSAASKLRSSLGNKFRYSYILSAPVSSDRLLYEDDRIKIQFRVDDAAIRFQLRNLSPSPLNIRWSEASIGIQGKYDAVRNARTYYATNPMDAGSPMILPSGYVVDLAIPAENVFHNGSKWEERDLLPTADRNSAVNQDRIRKSVGTSLVLVLPMEIGEEVHRYSFQFTVASVDSLPWERYRRPRRPAPPPGAPPAKATSDDNLITIAVVVGIVGISALLITQKKSPPSE